MGSFSVFVDKICGHDKKIEESELNLRLLLCALLLPDIYSFEYYAAED
jgi:hypothetical protein